MEKRQAILEAVIDEFSTHGYDNANVAAIAERAGVSKRTLYNHFQSKEALFNALVDEMARRISLSATLDYATDVPLRTQLLRYADESRRLVSQSANLRLLRAVVAEHIRNPQRVEPVLEGYWRNEYGLIPWMQAARRDGKLAGDPARGGHTLSAMLKSIIFWPAILGRVAMTRKETDRAVSDAIDMFLAFYAVKP